MSQLVSIARDVRPPAEPAPAPTGRRGPRVSPILSVAVVVAAFVGVLPRIASYGDVWRQLADTERGDSVLIGVLAVWNLVSYWPLVILGLPGLTVGRAAVSSQVGTAISNTVPAGAAFGAGVTVSMYRHWGFGASVIARALVVTGVWNIGSKLLLAALAIALAPVGSSFAPASLGLAAAGMLAVSVGLAATLLTGRLDVDHLVAWLERMASSARRRLGRPAAHGWVAAFDRFRAESGDLIARRWAALSVAALISHLSLFAVFAASLHGLAVTGVSLLEALAAFSVVRVVLIAPVTPGGAGVAEVGLAGLLVGAGADEAAAVAAVLVFRAVTWGVPIVIGAACWLLYLREQRSRTSVGGGGGGT